MQILCKSFPFVAGVKCSQQMALTDGANRSNEISPFEKKKKCNLSASPAAADHQHVSPSPGFFFSSASEKVRRLKVAAPQQPAGNCVSWGAARGSGPYFIENQSNCCFHSMTDLNGPLDHPPLVPLFVYKLSFFYSFSFLLVSINKFIGKFSNFTTRYT